MSTAVVKPLKHTPISDAAQDDLKGLQRMTLDMAPGNQNAPDYLRQLEETVSRPGTGTAGKVIAALQCRLGQAPLDIQSIANHLGMSRRTLQRRLSDQQTQFVELRDHVRFRRAASLLVATQSTIDEIAKAVDFSDRTGFNNAFKRWTGGITAGAFRKTFRNTPDRNAYTGAP